MMFYFDATMNLRHKACAMMFLLICKELLWLFVRSCCYSLAMLVLLLVTQWVYWGLLFL
jgi:hypothetical protein